MVACRRLCFRISPGQTWFTTDRGARTSVRRASSSSMWLIATLVCPQPISRASIAPGLSRMNSRAFTWCAHGLGGWAVVVISCLLAFCFLRKSSWRCVESSLPGCYNKSRDLPARWSPLFARSVAAPAGTGFSFSSDVSVAGPPPGLLPVEAAAPGACRLDVGRCWFLRTLSLLAPGRVRVGSGFTLLRYSGAAAPVRGGAWGRDLSQELTSSVSHPTDRCPIWMGFGNSLRPIIL